MNKWYILLIVNLAACIGLFVFSGPIPQPMEYHDFADKRTIMGIPYFGDVVSNIPFIIVGLIGLIFVISEKIYLKPGGVGYLLIFFGLFITGFGSGYYHLNPTNEALVWDRACMAVALMGLLGLVLEERTNTRVPIWGYVIFLIFGIGSVFYWIYTEHHATGDLRFYALTQYATLITVCLILILWPSKYTHGSYFWLAMACYVLAKITEATDKTIWEVLQVVSGHNIKHVLAALGGWYIYLMLKKRKIRENIN